MMKTVRVANPSDLEAIYQLEKSSFPDPWSKQLLEAELLEGSKWPRVWLIDQEQILGYLICSLVLDKLEIWRLAIAPQCRTQGLGHSLLKTVLRAAYKQGANCCDLELRTSNKVAEQFYLRAGFSIVGTRPNYYDRPREAALLMRRSLADLEIEVEDGNKR